jgi:hypothetical protein
MGKTLLFILAGFAVITGTVFINKNRLYGNSVDRMVEKFHAYSAGNASASGAYMALNQLYQSGGNWTAGYENLAFAGNSLGVVVEDDMIDPSLGPNRLRILSTGQNANASKLTEVMVFRRHFREFAVWAKRNVANVVTQDSVGAPDMTLLIPNAPYMPEIDYDSLTSMAALQGHVRNEPLFIPLGNYPSNNFYFSGTTPNVTHVKGSMQISVGLLSTLNGIFVVEGNVIIIGVLYGNTNLRGVLYLPNSSSSIITIGTPNFNLVGGVLTWGGILNLWFPITVRHHPEYLRVFVSFFAPNNPPLRILSWK